MPYDYPTKTNWKSLPNDVEKQYTESVHYSDEQMGKFFSDAKKETWYQNTLFVVVSDHSHNTIKQHEPISPDHHHIPLLFLGGALKKEWEGKTWDKIVSQLDIPSTILHQLNLPSKEYVWSRNIFNPYTPSSAYYVVFGAAGYINEIGSAGSHQRSKFILHSKNIDTIEAIKLNNKAMSFQQLIYEDLKAK
jgi:phosphoglycerol transferase MdoB-like AlkP superfamily enzyme